MPYEYCIWDFNGTLLDDITTCISSVNALLDARGLPLVKGVEHYRKIFRFPVIEYYKTLGFDFEKEPYDKLAIEWVSLYLENVKQARLYDDAEDALRQFREHGVKQSVLSATEASMLKGQLDSLGISGYFEQT
ncbi:MAG: HAD family hydrolase, partial [Clostridia bacterium]|nr:HAD family hydrolase [Clostridia bacterium]